MENKITKIIDEWFERNYKVSLRTARGQMDELKKNLLKVIEKEIDSCKIISENSYGKDDGTDEILLTKYLIDKKELKSRLTLPTGCDKSCECDCHSMVGGSGKPCPKCAVLTGDSK